MSKIKHSEGIFGRGRGHPGGHNDELSWQPLKNKYNPNLVGFEIINCAYVVELILSLYASSGGKRCLGFKSWQFRKLQY